MKYEAAIFDLDGTLLDTLEDLKNACNHVLTELDLPTRTLEEIRSFVGNGILNLIRRAVPAGTDEEIIRRAYERFLPWYNAHCMDETRPYPGIPEVITALRNAGLRTAVVSNKADPAVQELISHFFPGRFDAIAGEKEGVRKKPAPDTVFSVLHTLDCPPEKAVYIGDSDVDIETAANAGTSCIAVTWGFRSREFLLAHGAEILAEEPEMLCDLITGA